ncbi:MAG: cyclase family protein [Acidimicrobiia bacterium]|nr:cyclase family protein [Acidimicrobiia bacterium]
MTAADLPTDADLDAMFSRIDNRGRWGDDDERGTLNYITDAKVAQVAGGVRSGRVVSIGRDIDTTPSAKNPNPAVHKMIYEEHHPISALDQLTIQPHGFGVTHLDAVGHVYTQDGVMYNGREAAAEVKATGMTFGSIQVGADGIITRGILLDVAGARGVDWLEPTDSVTPNDLDAALDLAGIQIESGDAVFVRVGLGRREEAEGLEDPSERAGLTPDCLLWLHEKEVAVYSGDCVEKMPLPYQRFPLPLHMIGLPAMGLCLLDCPQVEPLVEACREEGRSQFMLVVAPLRIPGGTGSPVNPLCVF